MSTTESKAPMVIARVCSCGKHYEYLSALNSAYASVKKLQPLATMAVFDADIRHAYQMPLDADVVAVRKWLTSFCTSGSLTGLLVFAIEGKAPEYQMPDYLCKSRKVLGGWNA